MVNYEEKKEKMKNNQLLGNAIILILIFLAWVITVSPEYRNLGFVFYLLSYITYISLSKKASPSEDVKRLTYLVILASIVAIIVMVSGGFDAGFIYLVMASGYYLLVYRKIM